MRHGKLDPISVGAPGLAPVLLREMQEFNDGIPGGL
jgi:hypothetical protein